MSHPYNTHAWTWNFKNTLWENKVPFRGSVRVASFQLRLLDGSRRRAALFKPHLQYIDPLGGQPDEERNSASVYLYIRIESQQQLENCWMHPLFTRTLSYYANWQNQKSVHKICIVSFPGFECNFWNWKTVKRDLFCMLEIQSIIWQMNLKSGSFQNTQKYRQIHLYFRIKRPDWT